MQGSTAAISFADYLSSVSFRVVKPEVSAFPGHRRLARYFSKVGVSLEELNTRLDALDADRRRALRELCRIPKMSTFAIGAAINRAVSQMREGECFVNVGVWNGFSFLAGLTGNPDKRCIGIDNFSHFGGPREAFLERFHRYKSANHFFYDMDYQKYFAEVHQGPIGCYLYDGDHGYKHQLQGLEVARPFLAKGCIILVDDTNDPEPRAATLDFMAKYPNTYRLVFDRRTHANGHPTWWNGLMALEKIA